MYIPKHFAVEDREALYALVRANPFGLLVGELDGSPYATHLPFLLDGDRLLLHFARGNPHWKVLDGQTEMLAVFSGPHGYVSPRWYEAEQAVPTWNYAAVHLYGTPRPLEDVYQIRDLLDQLVWEYEKGAWLLKGLANDFIDRMSRGIVAFEMPIERIEGKFKLSQNRPVEDRRRVIAEFEKPGNSENRELARLMRVALDGD
jgi:transcriptional regulator